MSVLRNITKGSFLHGSGLLVVLAGAVGVTLTREGLFGFFLTGVPLWCFGVIAAAGGVMFFLGPMVFGLTSVDPSMRTSGKPERMLFLYLRPFELDVRNVLQLLVGASAGVLAYMGQFALIGLPFSFMPLFINISKEQGLKDALSPLGDFIACGRPGERLQPVGAARVYVKDDWKREISEYMKRARLVIVRPGDSPSIRWEVCQVLATVPPERILFYLRFRGWGKRKQRAYEAFRECVRARLGAELPERPGKAQYLTFDASGRPRFVREANRLADLTRQVFSRSGDVTSDRFRPVLDALDIEVPTRSRGLAETASQVFLWLCALFSITIVFVAVMLVLLRMWPLLLRLLRLGAGI